MKSKINWIAVFGWMVFVLSVWMIFASVISPLQAVVRTIVVFLFFGSIVWFNIKVLIPRYVEHREFLKYAFLALAPAILLALIRVRVEDALDIQLKPMFNQAVEFNLRRYTFLIIVNHLIAVAAALLYHFAAKWSTANKREALLKSEKLEAELNFLKGQVSPHFLFNTLNNIYTLCYLKDDKAGEMVLKLSSMMRYLMDEGGAKDVLLTSEIKFLESYLDLQKLKSSAYQKISMQTVGITGNARIAPFLLLPFFENIFKHSDLEQNEKGWCTVRILLKEQKMLHVLIANSKPPGPVKNTTSGGFGQRNVRQRLSLIYDASYTLEITEEISTFEVKMILPLK